MCALKDKVHRLEMRSEQLRILLQMLPEQCAEARAAGATLTAMRQQLAALERVQIEFLNLNQKHPGLLH